MILTPLLLLLLVMHILISRVLGVSAIQDLTQKDKEIPL